MVQGKLQPDPAQRALAAATPLAGERVDEAQPVAIRSLPERISPMRSRRCAETRLQVGFTLIELMITLAVAAVLAMIAVPNFRHLLVSMHLSDLGSSLSGDLQYARTEAVTRQVRVAVAASAGSWANGWTVAAAPATTSPTTPWAVLRRRPAVGAQYVVDAAPGSSVTYQPQGSAQAAACFTLSAPATDNTPIFLQVSGAGMLQQTTGTTTAPDAALCPPLP